MKSVILMAILLGLSQKFDKPICDFLSNPTIKNCILSATASYGLHMYLCTIYAAGHILAARVAENLGAQAQSKKEYNLTLLRLKSVPLGVVETYPEFKNRTIDNLVTLSGPLFAMACSYSVFYLAAKVAEISPAQAFALSTCALKTVSGFHMACHAATTVVPAKLPHTNFSTCAYKLLVK